MPAPVCLACGEEHATHRTALAEARAELVELRAYLAALQADRDMLAATVERLERQREADQRVNQSLVITWGGVL